MIDFSTRYLGLKLSGPIVVSSTPLSESLDNLRRMEDAGAAAVVLTSLFEEQLALESRALAEDLSRGTESFAESLGYLPEMDDYRMTQDVYLEHLRRAKSCLLYTSFMGWARTEQWARTKTRSRSSGARRTTTRRVTLCTTQRSRGR